jgi:chondroitin AC lyase
MAMHNILVVLLISIHFLITVNNVTGQSTEPDLEILKDRFTAELLESSVDEQQIEDLIRTIREDGTWRGINYEDTTRSGFEHRIHVDNLVDLGRAYQKENSAFYGDTGLKHVIWRSLDFWLEHDFICEKCS